MVERVVHWMATEIFQEIEMAERDSNPGTMIELEMNIWMPSHAMARL